MYAVNPIPVNKSSVAADRAFIGSAPHHASTAATASTPVTTHSVIVCTVPTASAEPAIAAASTHRLARVIGVEPALPWLPVVVIARLGEYLRLSVAADLPGVRMSSLPAGFSQLIPSQPPLDGAIHHMTNFTIRPPRRRPTPRWLLQVLRRVHRHAAAGSVRFTLKALEELIALDLGLDEADACRLLRGLHATNSSGRLRSEQTGEWLYVFVHRVASEAIYVKLVLRSDCVVVSFHEQVNDEDQ